MIGGRGSGKSTILNLIASYFEDNLSYFRNNQLTNDKGGNISKEDYIDIDTTTDKIEFISQNEIERHAESGELTDAIYDRIKQRSGYDEFRLLEASLNQKINIIDKHIKHLFRRKELNATIKEVERIIENDQKVITSLSDEVYLKLTEERKKLSDKIIGLENSKQKYSELVEELTSIVDNYEPLEVKNRYDEEINKIINTIEELLPDDETDKDDLETKEVEKWKKQQIELQKQLESHLLKLGINEEQINDHERAAPAIAENMLKLNDLKRELKTLEEDIDTFKAEEVGIEKDRINIETKIRESLTPLNQKLRSKNTNKNVADIKFEYKFDSRKAEDSLFDFFMGYFTSHNPKNLKIKKNAVRDYLFRIPPKDINRREDFIKKLEDKNQDANSWEFLMDIFEDTIHFEIYKLLIKIAFNDVEKQKKILGYYDAKDLRDCSFGQRCTAVIVALIMFGNRPLLIDEPEAHLDSKLIAEYLVNLIKEKKMDRQIIFATHNANFVVNGDAELIHVLNIDRVAHKTKVISTSIENKKHRDLLLALEGGKEAFELRKNKIVM